MRALSCAVEKLELCHQDRWSSEGLEPDSDLGFVSLER